MIRKRHKTLIKRSTIFTKHKELAFMLLILTFTWQRADAYDFETDNIRYNIVSEEDRTCEVCGCYVGLESLNVPSTVFGKGHGLYTVIGVGTEAFYWASDLLVQKVTLPNTVKYIADRAFYGTRISNIVLSESLDSIGESAFSVCSYLETVKFPKSLKVIGAKAFSCSGLCELTIPCNVDSIAYQAFYNCSNLKTVTIEDSDDELYLGYERYHRLGAGRGLFYSCDSLKTVYIGRPLRYIAGQNYGASPFAKNSSLREVTFGENVTEIGNEFFSSCTGLEKVVMPKTITYVGYAAFKNCSSLVDVKFSDSVTDISSELFAYCRKLRHFDFPDNVSSIGSEAFYYCDSLGNVEIPATVESIGDYAFSGSKRMTDLHIPNSVVKIGNSAFRYCDSLRNVSFEDGDTPLIVGSGAQYVYVNVETPGQFTECPIVSFYLGRNVSYNSDESPIKMSETLRTIKIGDRVTKLGYRFFYKCTGLTELEIPASVTTIGQRAFEYCTNLQKITIGTAFDKGESTRAAAEDMQCSIGELAFNGCTSLDSIFVLHTTPPTAKGAFMEEHYARTSLNVPSISLEAYKTADVWKNFFAINGINVTKINNVTINNDKDLHIYNLQGHRLTYPKRGLNIVNGRKMLLRREGF